MGNCYDNIFAERLIGTLKNEYNLDGLFIDLDFFAHAVEEVVVLYNTDRPHLSLNMAVPKTAYFELRRDIPTLVIPDGVAN